ncbi:MAG: hypothetical protein HGA36_01995 [Candidatus Moranbacteria bacterium]|nr:hypothetical protein [Candidatus Moranbacteria bacterium]
MSTKNTDKKTDVIKELEKTISPILVVNNSALKPYVELFQYAPENIYQQPLGSLVGFFEVKEFSDESAYIVNFLTSVLKKEYYINPKRPVTESLDSALHKVNMALSELAKHGNVEWLGKLNAAICVLEKNNTHFSVAGDAKIFLYRNQGLSEISEDLASESLEPHPLKTFVNVSSGRLEKDDRLLITSADIFHILTIAELKKNFQRFEGDKFVQFLKTALSNQMEMIVSVVVEMIEMEVLPVAKTNSRKKTSRAANAFSEQTFANTIGSDSLDAEQEAELAAEMVEDPEYTDKKTGHIYVQGQANENPEASHAQMGLYWDIVKEKISQGSYSTKNEIRRRFSLYKKQLAKKKELRRIEQEKQLQLQAEENERLEKERALAEIELQQKMAEQAELDRIQLEQEAELSRIQREQEEELEKIRLKEEDKRLQLQIAKEKIQRKQEEKLLKAQMAREKASTSDIISREDQRIAIPVQRKSEEIPVPDVQSRFLEKLRLARMEQEQNTVINLSSKTNSVTNSLEQEFEDEEIATEAASFNRDKAFQQTESFLEKSKKQLAAFAKFGASKTLALFKSINVDKLKHLNIIPHFSKISVLFSRFSTKQKLYTLAALACIFIVPLFIVHFLNQKELPVATIAPVAAPTQAQLLANEKNIVLNAKVQSTFSNQNIVTALIANENPTVITKTSVVVLSNNQPTEFSLPANSGTPIKVAYMHDLSLVLIITDSGKVISFSPISTKFADNNITLASASKESFVGTYLTYLYVLDQKTNQINRFPRADGGFGEATSWLKDTATLAVTSDMTIDDNIYTVTNNQVLKFFKGKKVDFSLEASSTPVQFDKIYTTPDLQNFYALDNKNSRVIQYAKDGQIISQFYSELIKDGTSLSVDEQNKTAYISTATGLLSVSLQ